MKINPSYSNNIFINCPFDDEYEASFIAIVFAIYKCGFFPRCSKEDDDCMTQRLSKIQNIIEQCKYSIHDISRTELDANSLFPRFNMPFELGLFLGAKRFGDKNQKQKKALVLEKTRYSYQKYISDLNGVDPRAHDGEISKIITHIRNFLISAARRRNPPGVITIINDYNNFMDELDTILLDLGLNRSTYHFKDLCVCIEEWIIDDLEK